MAHKITVSVTAQKDVDHLIPSEKKALTKALDLMESVGQMGEPIHPQLNVWIYRIGRLRLVYKLLSDEIRVIKIARGI